MLAQQLVRIGKVRLDRARGREAGSVPWDHAKLMDVGTAGEIHRPEFHENLI